MMNKKGQGRSNVGMILTISVLAILLVGVAGFAIMNQIQGGRDVDPNVISTCDSTTSPTLSIDAYDRDTGAALTEGTNIWRVKGRRAWTAFTAGTGFAVDANEEIEFVMGVDTTDWTDNAYGQKVDSFIVPCKETPSVEYEMANDEVEDSLTATFLDNEETASAETYVADQTQDVFIKLQAGSNEYFGNPFLIGNVNVLVLGLNSTEWDAPEKVSIQGGVELKAVATPQRHAAVAGIIAYAYEMPIITEDSVKLVLSLNADGTTAPATDMTASMYAANYYYNSDNQEIEFGVETQDGVAVGTDGADTVTLDFTA